VSPNTPLPGGTEGGRAAGGISPHLPEIDRIIKVTAYYRVDGWVTVTVYYYGECNDSDWDACIERARYYIPIQRAPKMIKPKSYRAWKSKKYIEMWLKAVEEYIRDVSQAIEFAAANASEEVGKALREFKTVIKSEPPGRVTNMGVVVGGRVVELGPPPDVEAVSVVYYDPSLKWERPISPTEEYFYNIAYTYKWREAIERVAGCEVQGDEQGNVKIRCNSEEATFTNMVPPGEVNTTVKQLRSLADALSNDLARKEPSLVSGYYKIMPQVEIINLRIRRVKRRK